MPESLLEVFKELRNINGDKQCCNIRLAVFLHVFQLAVKKLVNIFP